MSQYTKSLLHFNGANNSPTFTDETGKVWTRNGNAKISMAQSKFGGASGLFDGTGDYIRTPAQADFSFGTGDFTIDFWARIAIGGGTTHVCSIGQYYTNSGGLINIGLSPWMIVGRIAVAGSGLNFGFGNFASIQNTWAHVAVVRSNGSLRGYLNGVAYGTPATSTHNISITTATDIGAYAVGGSVYYFNGNIDEFRISNTARWTANFTPPTSEYSIGLALNVVIESPENIREVINRIAYEASSMEYWDAGQHNLVYLPTHTTVSKTIDANRIDLGTISVGYTDRVDLLNSMTLWYRHYWSGYSGDAAFRKSVSDSDATSIAKFGTLSSEPLQLKYLGNTNDTLTLDNAQRAIRWILTQQKNPRVTVEFTGGYYLTDLTRSNLIQFSFTARDELDKAFSGLVSTSDKFIIMDIVRGTGQIKIKAVQLITL